MDQTKYHNKCVSKFADGGAVQADVRKADKHNVKNMPEKEAERVRKSEQDRERRAYIESGHAQGAEHELLNLAGRTPGMTVGKYMDNPLTKQAYKEIREAEDRAQATGGSAHRTARGKDDYQYAGGGKVKRKK